MSELKECFVQCSKCGKQVSNVVLSSLPEGLIVRAFVQCPECIKADYLEEREQYNMTKPLPGMPNEC